MQKTVAGGVPSHDNLALPNWRGWATPPATNGTKHAKVQKTQCAFFCVRLVFLSYDWPWLFMASLRSGFLCVRFGVRVRVRVLCVLCACFTGVFFYEFAYDALFYAVRFMRVLCFYRFFMTGFICFMRVCLWVFMLVLYVLMYVFYLCVLCMFYTAFYECFIYSVFSIDIFLCVMLFFLFLLVYSLFFIYIFLVIFLFLLVYIAFFFIYILFLFLFINKKQKKRIYIKKSANKPIKNKKRTKRDNIFIENTEKTI